MGGKSSQANSSQNTQNYDQRQVNTTTIDDRDVSQTYDLSDHSSSTNNIYGADAAAINAQNTAFLRDVGRDQTDGIKAIAAFGTDAINRMGASATDLFSTSSANAVRSFDLATARSTDAWSATVEKSTSLIDKLLTGANNTVNAARDISQQAITSYQPAENKAQDTSLRLGMIAAAGVAVLMLTRKS